MSRQYPIVRNRRLRRTGFLRELVQEHRVSAADLIYPIFVEEGVEAKVSITSMPGIERIPERQLGDEIKRLTDLGVRSIMMFGISHHKDVQGGDSLDPQGLLSRMVAAAKQASPEMVVMADTCFCEYTYHGHCGVLDDTKKSVDNDATLELLGRQSVVSARAGADVIAPSAMMDGQVVTIRNALDSAGFSQTPIMSYSTKFASGFYGPFRAAAGCELDGDRKTYQMDPANRREALYESLIDAEEGADILMVKPGMPYLDVLADIRRETLQPLCVYQVSGEYAMIKFAAQAGAIDERAAMLESLLAFKRAGADLILTYFAPDALPYLKS
jgi:porphobilinogen synthase